MRASLDNFLYFLKNIVTGVNAATNTTGTAKASDGGIKRELAMPLGAVTLDANTTLSATAGIQELVTTTASTGNMFLFSMPITRDYDEASDNLVIRVNIALANADAGITLTGTPVVQPAGKAVGSAGTTVTAKLPFQTANANLSTTFQVVELNFSGLGLTRDAVIGIQIAFAGTITGSITTTFVEILYDSTIVSYNDTDATGVDGKLGGYGNPLR